MRVVITDGKGGVSLDDVAVPRPNPWQCLCRMNACATCSGTDRKLAHGGFSWADDYPAMLGHESIGTVIECGANVRNFRVGDRVLRPTAAYPGTRHDGFASWMGGFAEYGLITDVQALGAMPQAEDPFGYTRYQQIVPADLNISDADATMLVMLKEVAGVCFSADIRAGQRVLVLGSGSVAQSFCFYSAMAGAQVFAAARRSEPLQGCGRAGAQVLLCTQEHQDWDREILDLTGGYGVDYVFDAVGDVDFAVRAASLLAEGGIISSYASAGESGLPVERIHARGKWSVLENTLMENQVHDRIMQLVRENKLPLKLFYTHTMPLEDFSTGFNMLEERRAGKIVFTIS